MKKRAGKLASVTQRGAHVDEEQPGGGNPSSRPGAPPSSPSSPRARAASPAVLSVFRPLRPEAPVGTRGEGHAYLTSRTPFRRSLLARCARRKQKPRGSTVMCALFALCARGSRLKKTWRVPKPSIERFLEDDGRRAERGCAAGERAPVSETSTGPGPHRSSSFAGWSSEGAKAREMLLRLTVPFYGMALVAPVSPKPSNS